MGTAPSTSPEKNSRWQWLLIVLVIPISFACVLFSTQVALSSEAERVIEANMLPASRVSYQLDAGDQWVFAPQDAAIILEITQDANKLQITPELPSGSSTPVAIAQLPANPTQQPHPARVEPTSAPTEKVHQVTEAPARPTNTAAEPTGTFPPPTKTPILPSDTPVPPSATPTEKPPTMTSAPATKTQKPTKTKKPKKPTNTPVPTSSFTPVPSRTSTATNLPPASHTPVPLFTATGTATSTPLLTASYTPIPSNTPMPTNTPVYKNIKPFVNCATNNGNGTVTAFFGYTNRNDYDVDIPIGEENRFFPAPKGRGQPHLFKPGRHNNAFSVTFDESLLGLIWYVDGNVTAAWIGSPPCP